MSNRRRPGPKPRWRGWPQTPPPDRTVYVDAPVTPAIEWDACCCCGSTTPHVHLVWKRLDVYCWSCADCGHWFCDDCKKERKL